MYLRVIVLGLAASLVIGLGTVAYDFGYNQGYKRCNQECKKLTNALTDRSKQEELHEILGRYQGSYTDNESYDVDRINRLFR